MEQRDELIFEEVLAQNKERLWRLCRVYTLNTAESADLYQEIAVRIWKGLQSYEGRSALATWLYRIAINTAINYRLKAKHPYVYGAMQEEIPDKAVGENVPLQKLYDYIKRLNEADRSLITLHLEDFSHKEIAEIVGISENYVAVKLSRIREKLSAQFKSDKNG